METRPLGRGGVKGKTTTMATDTGDLWGMLYADDAGIVSHSPGSLEKSSYVVIVRLAGRVGLMVMRWLLLSSEPKER